MNNLKSIFSLFFFTTSFFSVNGITPIRNTDKIIDDLPADTDISLYLNSLEGAVDFYARHKLYVDLSAAFGLFMADVNLRSHLQQTHYEIPVKIRSKLEKLLLKVDVLVDFFHYMVRKTKGDKKYGQDIKLSELFYNKTTWSRAPDKFNTNLLKQTKIYNPEQLKRIYGKWEDYLKDVDNPEEFIPSPEESDNCLQILAESASSRSPVDCRIPSHCKKSVEQGTDFGYSLSHRILFMTMARLARQCVVFSEKDDKHKTDKFCMKSFNEVQYIALNNLQSPDLLSENIALCGLLGHAQFFRNLWLKNLTQFQTSEGCFLDSITTEENEKSPMREGDNDEWLIANPKIMNGQCNGHFTAVSIVTFSNTIRYIIETYF